MTVPLNDAEKAAAGALARDWNLRLADGIERMAAEDFAAEARAVVAAVRSATWLEAAAFLRSIADEPGVRDAADILDNAAQSLSRPTSEETQK